MFGVSCFEHDFRPMTDDSLDVQTIGMDDSSLIRKNIHLGGGGTVQESYFLHKRYMGRSIPSIGSRMIAIKYEIENR